MGAELPGMRIDRPLEGVVRLLLDRPDRRNALDPPLAKALLAGLMQAGDAVVVLGSTSPRSFCAGADLSISDAERAAVSDLLYELYERMLAHPAPIVAALDGHVIGGGAQLAIASDLRVGGPGVRIRFAGPGHGLAVGAWGLPSLVGRSRALDLCLTMRSVEAEEALRIGLIDRIDSDPAAAALALARAMADLDRRAVAEIKRLANEGAGLLRALRQERQANSGWGGAIARGGRDG